MTEFSSCVNYSLQVGP